jgi:hypothetical protein
MQLKRPFMGFVLGISASLLASTSFAQSFPCTQSMIAGNWEIILSDGTLYNPSFACPISIASNGTLSTTGACTPPPTNGQGLTTPPSGQLLINSSCKVSSPISWVQTFILVNVNPKPPPPFLTATLTVTVTAATHMWRSLDGSRLSGFLNGNIHQTVNPCPGPTCSSDFVNYQSVELIYKPQPPPPP